METEKNEQEETITEIIEVLSELLDDVTVPRNIKTKVQSLIDALKGADDITLKVSKVLHELESVGDDINLQPYTRTQLFNIISMLEKI